MKTKFIKPETKIWKTFKRWMSELFRKKDDDDNFYDNPYAVF